MKVLETHSVRNQNVATLDAHMVHIEFQPIMSKYSHRENLGDISRMKTIL